jgi:protein-tyrosine phosphatase
MPGLAEPLESAWEHVRAENVQAIVNLARPDEIHEKSPAYAQAIKDGHVPCSVIAFPVENRGSPEGREAFWQLAFGLARRIEAGETILIHCAAGRGRTGTLATCVLVALGETQAGAAKAVRTAGSTPETSGQTGIVAWCAQRRQQQG